MGRPPIDVVKPKERCKYCGRELSYREIGEHESSHRLVELLKIGQAIRWAFLRGSVQSGDVVKKDVKGGSVQAKTFDGELLWIPMEDIL